MCESGADDKKDSASSCQVFLDNQPCYPGQIATGRVECVFSKETKIRGSSAHQKLHFNNYSFEVGVQVVFEGEARVQFGANTRILKEEKYCCVFANAMNDSRGMICCPPGRHKFEFLLHIPQKIPASITLKDGYICYGITTVVEMVGESNITSRRKVCVGSFIDLNAYSMCKKAINRSEEKGMMVSVCTSPAITVEVTLPQGGYVPSQVICLTAKVHNRSNRSVLAVRFKIVQIFRLFTQDYQQQYKHIMGTEQYVEDSCVAAYSKKSWEVRLKIPNDALAPDLTGCNIIKMQCEVVGTVVLPFPHNNLKIKVPFYLGTVPVAHSAI